MMMLGFNPKLPGMGSTSKLTPERSTERRTPAFAVNS